MGDILEKIEKSVHPDERLTSRDVDLILEVNRRAIEIHSAVSEQNESIINRLAENKERIEKVLDKIDRISEKSEKTSKQIEDMNKDIFKIQILFATGIASLIIQLIQMFFKK